MKCHTLTFAILIVLIPSIISLKCYVCNSNLDGNCASSGSLTAFAVTCNQSVNPYCRKIAQTVDQQKSTARTCGSNMGSKPCYLTSGTNSANVCSCNTDLCNNARNVNQQQRIVTIISSLAVLGIPVMILR